jgi:LCP family protein required for cell wall assembly
MIARVDLVERTVRAVSIPRDLYVEIPGVGYDKITRAYDYGSRPAGDDWNAGMDLVAATVEANFGLAVDAVVLTTFQGFVQIVDALGGIDLVNPYDLYDAEYPTWDYGYKEIYYPAGPLQLGGEEALEFARTRHQDGDDGRVMRQQLVLRALLERVRDPAIAADLPAVVAAARDAVRTTLTPAQMLALALAAPEFSNDGVTFGVLTPYLWSGYAPNGAWIYQGDWSQLSALVQGFLDGTAAL